MVICSDDTSCDQRWSPAGLNSEHGPPLCDSSGRPCSWPSLMLMVHRQICVVNSIGCLQPRGTAAAKSMDLSPTDSDSSSMIRRIPERTAQDCLQGTGSLQTHTVWRSSMSVSVASSRPIVDSMGTGEGTGSTCTAHLPARLRQRHTRGGYKLQSFGEVWKAIHN